MRGLRRLPWAAGLVLGTLLLGWLLGAEGRIDLDARFLGRAGPTPSAPTNWAATCSPGSGWAGPVR